MNVYLALLLAFTSLIAIGWILRQRSPTVLWRGQQYRTVLDNLEDAILVYDKNKKPVYLNRAARAWFGLDEAESYETQPLRTQISPLDDFFALLSRSGRASFKIGSRQVEAVSQQIRVQGADQTILVVHDVTAAQALLAEERRRVRELAVFNEINQAINASLELDELLNAILKQLKPLFPYTSAAISLWNPRTEQLILKGYIGPGTRTDDVLPVDRGYAVHLIREQEPLLLEDTSQQPKLERTPSTRSYMGIPLLTGSNLIGTLELFSDQVNAFSTESLAALRVVASHAAVAIENARLYSETLARAEEMATMNTLSSAINASLNLDELLEIVAYSISQAIGCDRSAIFLMDSERGLLSLAKSLGLSEDFVRQNQNIRPELGGQAQVVLDRYPLVVSDIRQVKAPAEFVSLLKQEGIRAYVDMPLRGREHVLGALTVYYDQPHTFDEAEQELLRTFANQVTLALENARLYERTDRALARRVNQLAAIEEIGRELTSTLDLTGVFNLVLQRAMGTTGASAGLLAVCVPNSEYLELIVDRGFSPKTLKHYMTEGWHINHGIVGRVARTGETALVNDVNADPDYIVHLPDTRAQLVVPIAKEGRVLGVVSLESSRIEGFSPDDVRFTTQLAELAAIAIDNARLFQQVSEGRDNLQAILDSTRDGILVMDRDGRIVLANPMVEELSSLPAQTLVGQRASDLASQQYLYIATLLGYPTYELEDALKPLDSTSKKVTKRTYEMPGSPSRFIEQVASPVIDKDAAVVGRLVVFRDITEERDLALMRQDLTDMIIHDLRSPLTTVVGGVQVAVDLIDSQANPSIIRQALDMANQSCDRLVALVDSLLDISRLEAGQMPLERHPVLLPNVAKSVVQQMQPIAERDMITLQLHTDSKIPPVDADSELISRVLVNLLDNAMKHSPQNSIVTIKVDLPSPETDDTITPDSADISAEFVRCMVLDMGPGIPDEFRKRVFERFAQLDGRQRGKGLGLAFCRLAVEAHGGHIWVEDNPAGQGSAFVFTLPVAELLTPPDLDSIE